MSSERPAHAHCWSAVLPMGVAELLSVGEELFCVWDLLIFTVLLPEAVCVCRPGVFRNTGGVLKAGCGTSRGRARVWELAG
ncbi:hypothetical protein SRHO_G00301660 [Serrasalmus rhombeus]